MKTRLTTLLGIDQPIVLPGMSWISKAELVAAVCEAGGLGILATGPLQPDETREAIRQVRERTDRPFGVGVTLMMPGATQNAKIALEEEVPVVNFQLGKGEWIIEGAHAYGGVTIATVTSERHARSAEAATSKPRSTSAAMMSTTRVLRRSGTFSLNVNPSIRIRDPAPRPIWASSRATHSAT